MLDDYQTRLQRALEVSGEAWVSTTVLRGRTYLRAGVVNYLSTSDDIDRLLTTLRAVSEGVLEDLDLSSTARTASRTLATSNRTAPGLSRCVRRKVCAQGPELLSLACGDGLASRRRSRCPAGP